MANPMQVADGMVVRFDYVLRLDDGSEIDRSAENDPLPYLHGSNNIIPGLEKAMSGLGIGDEKRVMVQPAEGYGEYNPANKQIVPITAFPKGFNIEEGENVQIDDEATGKAVTASIESVLTDKVVLDLNHPLAGEKLFFSVKVVDIRGATKEELANGQVK